MFMGLVSQMVSGMVASSSPVGGSRTLQFFFEFDFLCRTYGYTDDTHNLGLFPATFKTVALKWFMRLGEHTITSWDDMRNIFLKKY